jgi:hypothetical protein
MKPAARIAALALLVSLCAASVSCGTPPPELDEVRGTFEALISASAEINDIFFGAGLPVYDRETSTGDATAQYDAATRTYFWYLDDPAYGTVVKYYPEAEKVYRFARKVYLAGRQPGADETVYSDAGGEYVLEDIPDYRETERELVYDENSPVYYDYVRLECPYQSVDQIKVAAEKVYSSAYLDSVYTIMFDGLVVGTEIIYARYSPDESGATDFLLKSNRFDPYFTEQTEYDFSSMKIVMPSRGDMVNVEITATGSYLDLEKLEKVRGTYTKNLKFVLQDGQWRLDTPTY